MLIKQTETEKGKPDMIYPITGGADALPLILTSAGEKKLSRHSTFTCRDHTLACAVSGEAALSLNGEEYSVGKGTVIYLPPGQSCETVPQSELFIRLFTFTGKCADDITKTLGMTGAAIKSGLDDNTADLFTKFEDVSESCSDTPERCSALIYEILLAVSPVLSGHGKTAASATVSAALKYIDKQYMNEITLDRLAVLCGVSQQHFCRLFKTATGLRPMEYIARRRISESKRLLDDPDMMISDIATAVGCPDRNYFGILFKKYEGISPSDYRKLGGIKSGE